jgi:hypothetical protein
MHMPDNQQEMKHSIYLSWADIFAEAIQQPQKGETTHQGSHLPGQPEPRSRVLSEILGILAATIFGIQDSGSCLS